MYKFFVTSSEIPDDLESLLNENDIMFYNIDGKFDLAMLERGFFKRGTIRRSHRIITEKFKSLSLEEIYSSLTGEIKKNKKTSIYEKIIKKNENDLNYLINVLEEDRLSVFNSLMSWSNKEEHKDKDHNGDFNRKHYIDYFSGMLKSIDCSIARIKWLIEVKKNNSN